MSETFEEHIAQSHNQPIIPHFLISAASNLHFCAIWLFSAARSKKAYAVHPYTSEKTVESEQSTLASWFHKIPKFQFTPTELEKMHHNRTNRLVTEKVKKDIELFLNKDEIHQNILAEKAVNFLMQQSLVIFQKIIENPQHFPFILKADNNKKNEAKDEFIKDWLYEYEPFSYAILLSKPDFIKKFIDQCLAFAEDKKVTTYLSENYSSKENIDKKSEILSEIETERRELGNCGVNEIISDLSSNSMDEPKDNASIFFHAWKKNTVVANDEKKEEIEEEGGESIH